MILLSRPICRKTIMRGYEEIVIIAQLRKLTGLAKQGRSFAKILVLFRLWYTDISNIASFIFSFYIYLYKLGSQCHESVCTYLGETKIPGYLTSSFCAILYCTRISVLPPSVTKIWGDFPSFLTFSHYYFLYISQIVEGYLSFLWVIFLEVNPNSAVVGKISVLKTIWTVY